MPPINGQQNLNRNPPQAGLPSRIGQMQNYSPSGTPPPLQNSQPNVATSRPPPSNPQPSNFQSAFTTIQNQSATEAPNSNKNFQSNDVANVPLATNDTNDAAITQTATNPQSLSQFGPPTGQTSRPTQNLPNLNSRSDSNPTEAGSAPVNSQRTVQPIQTQFFPTPDQPRSSTQNIFAPTNTVAAASLSTPSYPAQPTFGSTQNLFGSTQNVQSSSQNVLGTVSNAIPNAQNFQYQTTNPNHRSLPNVSGPQTQFSTPLPPPTQYSTATNAQTISGPQTQFTSPGAPPPALYSNQLPRPPIGANQSQNLYGSNQNLASQRKYPQNAYGIQQQIGTANISGPPLAAPQVPGMPPAPVPLPGQYQSGPVQGGMPPLPGQQIVSGNVFDRCDIIFCHIATNLVILSEIRKKNIYNITTGFENDPRFHSNH